MTSVEEDIYVCPFDEATVRKAQEELNEDPKDRNNAIQALREWIKQQPHLRCRTDTRTLIMYLRGAKFSQLKARQMIEGSMMSHTECPEWFQNIDTCDPKLQAVLRAGYCVPLKGKDKNGCRILLYRFGALNLEDKSYTSADLIRCGIVAGAYMMQDEENQVNGLTFVFDMTGYTMKHMGLFSFEDIKRWYKCWQGNIPGRFKAFHYYNTGIVMDGIMAILKLITTKKFMERIMVHGNKLESLHKHIPMASLPKELAPTDYSGPHAGCMDTLTEEYIKEITTPEFRQSFLSRTSSEYGYDASKKPSDVDVPQASFRKLEVH